MDAWEDRSISIRWTSWLRVRSRTCATAAVPRSLLRHPRRTVPPQDANWIAAARPTPLHTGGQVGRWGVRVRVRVRVGVNGLGLG